MKKTFVFVVAFVLITVFVKAQEVAIGLKGGLNFAKIDGNTSSFSSAYKNHTGFNAGAFVLFKLSKIGIQPEVLFSQQGSKVTVNSQNFKSNFNYVNIPVLLKLYTVLGINIQVGPQFGFVMSAKQDEPDAYGNITSVNYKDQLKKADLSAAMGLGWDLPFGLSIDARYNLGLTKINSQAGSESAKNQVIQISVGYKIIKLGR
jgi:hypothetical protein